MGNGNSNKETLLVNTNEWQSNFRVTSSSRLSMAYRKMMLKVARFHELVADRQMKILDVGCGYGTSLFQLASLGYENLYGIEPDEALFRGIPPQIAEVKQGKAEKIPYPDATFDVVFVNGALHHILGIEQLYIEASKELDRVLKPSGYIFIMEPGRYWVHNFMELASNILGVVSKTFRSLANAIYEERAELNYFFKNHNIFRESYIEKKYEVKCDTYFGFCWIFSAKKDKSGAEK